MTNVITQLVGKYEMHNIFQEMLMDNAYHNSDFEVVFLRWFCLCIYLDFTSFTGLLGFISIIIYGSTVSGLSYSIGWSCGLNIMGLILDTAAGICIHIGSKQWVDSKRKHDRMANIPPPPVKKKVAGPSTSGVTAPLPPPRMDPRLEPRLPDQRTFAI